MNDFKMFNALGLSFKSWFRNFVPFTLLAVLLYAPVVVWIVIYDPTKASSPEDLLNKMFLWPIYLLGGISTLLSPMLTYRVIQDLNGTKVPMWTSVKFGVRGIIPAMILAIVVNVLQRIPGGGIVGAVLTCVWFVAAPAAVAEQLGVGAAFNRSTALTRGRRWGIFGLTFLIGLALIGMLFGWIVPMFKEVSMDLTGLRRPALLFVGSMGVFQLFMGIAQAVSYALLRQDKDGLNHADLAKVFE